MDSLDTTFAALADPTRRAIIAHLTRGEDTVNELVYQIDVSHPTISSHVKVLENTGPITGARFAQTGPCRLNPADLKPISEWLKDYERFWEETIDRFVHPYLGRKS